MAQDVGSLVSGKRLRSLELLRRAVMVATNRIEDVRILVEIRRFS